MNKPLTTQPDPQAIANTLMNGIAMCVRVLRAQRAVIEAKFLADLAGCIDQMQQKHAVSATEQENDPSALQHAERHVAEVFSRGVSADVNLHSSIWGKPPALKGDALNVRTMFILNLRRFSYAQMVPLVQVPDKP